MSGNTKDILGREKEPIKLSVEEFYEYSKTVKSIFFSIGFLVISFFVLGSGIVIFAALEDFGILNNIAMNILGVSCIVLFILSLIFIFKNIINKSKKTYNDKIIIIDKDILESVNSKKKWYNFRFKAMTWSTLIFAILGVIFMVMTEATFPSPTYDNGYILLSIASMFLMICIPLFLSVYLYSDIYIYNYINNKYNF